MTEFLHSVRSRKLLVALTDILTKQHSQQWIFKTILLTKSSTASTRNVIFFCLSPVGPISTTIITVS